MNAREQMYAFARSQSTQVLISAMVKLDRPIEEITPEDNMVRACITDTLCRRYPDVEKRMDEIFSDESPEGIDFVCTHSYVEILLAVLSGEGVIR